MESCVNWWTIVIKNKEVTILCLGTYDKREYVTTNGTVFHFESNNKTTSFDPHLSYNLPLYSRPY